MVKHIAIGYLVELANPIEQPVWQLGRPLPRVGIFVSFFVLQDTRAWDSLGAQSAEEGPRGIISLEDTTQKQKKGDNDHGDDKHRDKGAV